MSEYQKGELIHSTAPMFDLYTAVLGNARQYMLKISDTDDLGG